MLSPGLSVLLSAQCFIKKMTVISRMTSRTMISTRSSGISFCRLPAGGCTCGRGGGCGGCGIMGICGAYMCGIMGEDGAPPPICGACGSGDMCGTCGMAGGTKPGMDG